MDEVRRVTVEVSWAEFARRKHLTMNSFGELSIGGAIGKGTIEGPLDLLVEAEIVDVLSKMRALKARIEEILSRKAKP